MPQFARNLPIKIAVLMGAAFIFSGSPAADPAPRRLSLTVKASAPLDPSVAGIIVAKSTGLFEREALSVLLLAGQNDRGTIDYVTSNTDSIGIVSIYSFLLARGRSAPIVAFAAAYQRSPIVFYTLASSKIRSPEDFIDRTVGYQPDQPTAIIYEAMMAKGRISRSRIREVSATSDPESLANGSVDVLPGEISLALRLRRLGVEQYSIDPAQFGIHAPGTVFFTRVETLKNKPELLRRFLRGLINGWRIAYEDYSQSIPTIAEALGKDLSVNDIRLLMEQQRELLRPFGARLGELTRAQWAFAQNDLLQQRRLTSPVDIDAAIDEDIMNTVNRELGTPALQ